MSLDIPPVFFYVVGALLVVFGGLRVVHLGLRKSKRDLIEDTQARRKERRYHLAVGAVWVIMGLFLIVSTVGALRWPIPR